MAANKLQQMSLPQQFLLIGGTVFLISEFTKPKPPPENLPAQTAQTEADALGQQGIPLSYPLSAYQSAATILESAMGNDYDGTNELQIKGVFLQMNNLRDVLQLIASFGVRPYCNIAGMCANISLPYWFAEELTSSEIQQYINSVLSAKGINYTF